MRVQRQRGQPGEELRELRALVRAVGHDDVVGQQEAQVAVAAARGGRVPAGAARRRRVGHQRAELEVVAQAVPVHVAVVQQAPQQQQARDGVHRGAQQRRVLAEEEVLAAAQEGGRGAVDLVHEARAVVDLVGADVRAGDHAQARQRGEHAVALQRVAPVELLARHARVVVA
ncbi:hypothetical protein EG861_14355, partial [Enterococcus faecalis]